MNSKLEIVENILFNFYENRVCNSTEKGKKVDVRLVTLDDRLEKNINLILSKLNYKVSRQVIVNEQIYTMYSVLMKEVNGKPKFTNTQLLNLTDTEIVNITIKHLKFNDYKLLEEDVKRKTNSKTGKNEFQSLNPESLDTLIEKGLDVRSEEQLNKLSEFRAWLNINKYRILTDKQLYFLDNAGPLVNGLGVLPYKSAPLEFKSNISKHTTIYYKHIQTTITDEYEKYKRNKPKLQVENVKHHFKEYIELYESEKYLECLDLLGKVVKSSDIELNSKITFKNKYSEIEDYLSDKLESKYMQQIIKYTHTQSANDVKQSTLVEVYRLLQKGI